MRRWCTFVFALCGVAALAQPPVPPPASIKQLMLDLIHPSSNDISLAVYRGGPKDEREWASVRRSALALAESGNMLMARGRALDQTTWADYSRQLAEAGAAAYKAAQAKDEAPLAAAAQKLDDSCTACHKHYRPNVFPPDGGSK